MKANQKGQRHSYQLGDLFVGDQVSKPDTAVQRVVNKIRDSHPAGGLRS